MALGDTLSVLFDSDTRKLVFWINGVSQGLAYTVGVPDLGRIYTPMCHGNNSGAGGANMTSDSDGTIAIGYEAGKSLTTGKKNTAIGFEALKTLNAGANAYNTAVGFQAARLMSTGVRLSLIHI